ncbi:hypothetical protein D3C71_1706680 [compost metagenome]
MPATKNVPFTPIATRDRVSSEDLSRSAAICATPFSVTKSANSTAAPVSAGISTFDSSLPTPVTAWSSRYCAAAKSLDALMVSASMMAPARSASSASVLSAAPLSASRGSSSEPSSARLSM